MLHTVVETFLPDGGDGRTEDIVSAAACVDSFGLPLSTVRRRMLNLSLETGPNSGWFAPAPDSGSLTAGNFVPAACP